jgi:hypothetical protein
VWQLTPGRSPFWRRTAATFLLIWALGFVGAWTVERRAAAVEEAVVIAQTADVRNGPGPSFATAFVLHRGAETVVEGARAVDRVSLPGDLRGWIQAGSIEALVKSLRPNSPCANKKGFPRAPRALEELK